MKGSCSSCSSGTCQPSSDKPSEDRLPPGMLECYDITKECADGVIVLIEANRSISDDSKKALGKAKGLNTGRVFGMLFGPSDLRSVYQDAFAYGADTIYHFRSKDSKIDIKEYVKAFAEVSDRIHPLLLMMPSTKKGAEIAAAISSSSKVMMNECTDMRWVGNEFICSIEGAEKEVGGRLPVLVVLKSGSLPMPEKEDGRKGTAIIRNFH